VKVLKTIRFLWVLLAVPCGLLCHPVWAQKVLTVAAATEVTSIDPHKISGAGDYQFFNHVFEGLYGHDNNGKLIPLLAVSYRVSSDGKEYTFNLRPNVRFHNGERFTAADVRFSWQRSNSPEIKNPRAAIVTANISDVEVVNDLTVRVKLKAPDASILENLGEYFYIVSKATLDKVGNDEFGRQPVGTGPFKFVSRKIKETTELAAFTDYWGPKPKIDRLVMRIVTDPQTRVAMLRSGEADAIANVPPQVAKQLEADKNVTLIVKSGFQNSFIVINVRAPHGQFSDPRVRQALNMAIDRKTLIERVMFGFASPVAALCNPAILGCDIGREPYPFDPKRARALLEEAKFDFSRTYESIGLAPGRVSQSKETAEAVAFYLNRIGVKTKMEFIEYGAWLAKISAKEWDKLDLFWMGWTDYNNDPMGRLPRSWRTNGALSYNNDPKLDAMIDSANTIVDPKERELHLKRLFLHAYENPPSIFLWNYNEIYASRKNVRWEPRSFVSWPVFLVADKD
jgi:peptide/nickel transport system substrate-binding protein